MRPRAAWATLPTSVSAYLLLLYGLPLRYAYTAALNRSLGEVNYLADITAVAGRIRKGQGRLWTWNSKAARQIMLRVKCRAASAV